MEADMNNVMLDYKGYTISVAQHKSDGKVVVQEIAYWKGDDDMKFLTYSSDAVDFVETMKIVMETIDEAV